MLLYFLYIIFISLNFQINSKENKDIFEENKNLRFCGVDLLSNKIKYPLLNNRANKTRSLTTKQYKPIRIYVETTYFEYQGEQNSTLNPNVPIIKAALNKAVEGIKGLIQVEDTGDLNINNDDIQKIFNRNFITKWNSIFDNGVNINSDFLIIVKFDTEHYFPQGVLASAVPEYLDSDTYRPLIGLLTISTETSFFTKRRVTEYFSEVLLHELTHALGFLDSMFQYFPNGRDGTLTKTTLRGVERTIVKTPKVIEVAKKYFNCENIKGVELEDQGGQGSTLSHWEQRVLLGDYMGAVIYQEEMAVSELTLALLEDTGWYKANYYTGGLMRFGKNKGCDFIENDCLDSYYITQFPNEFFDLSEQYSPSCSAGRQSRTYSILNTYYQIMDYQYSNHFYYDYKNSIYYSGAMYTTDYCFTHGERVDEANNGYFTGNCKYGVGNYGYFIYYLNPNTQSFEYGHPNSELPSDLGEVYSNTSFCIMSSLSPSGKYQLYSSYPHPMCYDISCSSSHLTIKINNDLIVCPIQGGNVKVIGYDGFVNCPDYNLMCSGTDLCNDIFDCIEKKSLVKESSYKYDYIAQTTQKYSKIKEIAIYEEYELSDDGACPKYCSQCDVKKVCKKCKEGYDCDIHIDNETDSHIENETDSHIDNETDIHIDNETDSHIDNETDSQIDNKTDGNIDNETDSHIDNESDIHADNESDSHIDNETDSQIDNETDSHIDKETDSQIDNETDSHIDNETDGHIDNESDSHMANDTDNNNDSDIYNGNQSDIHNDNESDINNGNQSDIHNGNNNHHTDNNRNNNDSYVSDSNTTLWIILSIVIVLVLAGIGVAVYLKFRKKVTKNNNNNNDSIEMVQKNENSENK